ncbi:MAG: four helix bundle protein [Parcubacteria group bacterium]
MIDIKHKGEHEKMIVYQSICELSKIVQDILMCIPKTEYKMRSQIINANDSIASNFVEGYYSGYINEYLRFLTYSRRSGAELYERIKRVRQMKYIGENIYNLFEDRILKTMYLIDRTRQGLENSIMRKQS